jgi:hypothetical protein
MDIVNKFTEEFGESNPDVRKQNGFWTVFKMVMDNQQEKHQTILEFNEIDNQKRLKYE